MARLHIRIGLLTLVAGLAAWAAQAADYVVLTSGQTSGEMTVTATPAGREIRYRFNDRGRGPDVRSAVVLDAALSPTKLSVDGVDYMKLAVAERFERAGSAAAWRAANDSGRSEAAGFYLPAESTPEHLAMLARALLRAPEQRLPILPGGQARLEHLLDHRLEGRPGVARLFVVHGLGFAPEPLWLDEQGELILQGDNWFVTVRKGAEAHAPDLVARQGAALERRELARTAALARRPDGPVVFRGVSLFDPETRTIRRGMTVVVRDRRIEAVGAEGEVQAPAGATVIDGAGKTLLPGLWDMHAHVTGNHEGLLHLAAGVTSARDPGNTLDVLDRKRRFDALELAGPRITPAGFIDGPGPLSGPIKVLAATPDELRAAIRNYASKGFTQIKLYSSLDPTLVPVAVEEAHGLGLRVSGHVPAGMTMRQAVEAGFDEVHHLNFTALNFMGPEINAKTNGITRITAVAEHAWRLDPKGPEVAEFMALLKAKGVVVDPTMSLYENHLLGQPGQPNPNLAAVADRLPPVVRRGSAGAGLARTPVEEERNAKSFAVMLGLLKALYDAGVPLVAGTDDMAGFTYQRELELYEMAGIPPLDVLYIATLGAARVVRQDAELGSIAPGKLADLVLVDGAPEARISDLRKVAVVMKDGALFEPGPLLDELGVSPQP